MEDRIGEHRFALWAFVAWLAVTLLWWALAFAPLPAPPQWLAAARQVCFGTLDNGLPDTWGWIGLIASPLAMLGFLLAVWGRSLTVALRGLAASAAGKVALTVLVAVPLLGLAWVGQRVAQASAAESAFSGDGIPLDLPETYPTTDRAAPVLGLIDQHGDEVRVADFRGRPVLVTFAYAHCATVCPVVVRTVKTAAEQLEKLDPAVVIVSLDPWRDTPSSLPDLIYNWQLEELPEVRVLSGEVERVLTVLEAWNMPIDRDTNTGEITHPALVYVLDRDGDIGYTLNGPTARWVVQAAQRLDQMG